ncbi:hypothetical protein QJS04_geneDACA013065 [Acorus gramineus]|uniref:AAA+ ATPase domain-containing protein n=1 Tax=Acorus gramineus TaxID=55184 RepID=A0AAV9B1L2_ACOGR|nr:hypothetical protein QJS04_geneDACA013065 [Acorus gramineus]
METLNSQFLLIDLHSSFDAATRLRFSSLSALSARPRRRRTSISAASGPPPPVLPPATIRRPGDRFPPRRRRRTIEHDDDVPVSGPSTSSSAGVDVDEMGLFLDLVPARMRGRLERHGELRELIEVVMDLGRNPIARFPSGDFVISDEPVKPDDLRYAISKASVISGMVNVHRSHGISRVGDFSDDNRSGINRSLHRISAIRNRKLEIIGLTCRVGRAISGSADMIGDLIEGRDSVLVIGPPGVGKTTLIREIARMLADEHMKRVVIVDTSNEIGGDGDVPHSGIGGARRMQVPNVNMQHTIMIEAVENHMPEVIIIDEIGTELESMAASTIAQRGVQLVGTAHGVTIENVIKNPALQNLVGGIESVTLGDDEAKKRKVQKTILERKGPPTFTCAVEMISRTECRVHHRLDATVDAILAGKSALFEVRRMDAKSNNRESCIDVPEKIHNEESAITVHEDEDSKLESIKETKDYLDECNKKVSTNKSAPRSSPVLVYTYKILEADLLQVATVMGLENDIDVTDDIRKAHAILASKSEMKQNPWLGSVAKFHQLPVFVIKTNTMAQMVKAVRMILGIDTFGCVLPMPLNGLSSDIEIEDDAPSRKPSLEEIDALEEVRLAIEYIVIPGGEPVELLPRCSEIIARQLELVESYQLAAEKSGTELNSRLQILPMKLNKKLASSKSGPGSPIKGSGGSSVTRLPLLPD